MTSPATWISALRSLPRALPEQRSWTVNTISMKHVKSMISFMLHGRVRMRSNSSAKSTLDKMNSKKATNSSLVFCFPFAEVFSQWYESKDAVGHDPYHVFLIARSLETALPLRVDPIQIEILAFSSKSSA